MEQGRDSPGLGFSRTGPISDVNDRRAQRGTLMRPRTTRSTGPFSGINTGNVNVTSQLVSGGTTASLPSLFNPYSINNSGQIAGLLVDPESAASQLGLDQPECDWDQRRRSNRGRRTDQRPGAGVSDDADRGRDSGARCSGHLGDPRLGRRHETGCARNESEEGGHGLLPERRLSGLGRDKSLVLKHQVKRCMIKTCRFPSRVSAKGCHDVHCARSL